jgi:hypothetical protein
LILSKSMRIKFSALIQSGHPLFQTPRTTPKVLNFFSG